MKEETEIDRRYNPENDLIPNGPRVTWAEYELQQQVHALKERIRNLEQTLEKLTRV